MSPHSVRRVLILVSLFGVSRSLLFGAPAFAPTADVNKTVQSFFAGHCTECHGEKKSKGGLRLDTLGMDYTSPKVMAHWEEIMNRIISGEMPPEDERRPNPEVVTQVAEWIAAHLLERDAKSHASGAESVSFRKLSRVEYANTIRDLLGVQLDVTDPYGLPEDPAWQGFERIGS